MPKSDAQREAAMKEAILAARIAYEGELQFGFIKGWDACAAYDTALREAFEHNDKHELSICKDGGHGKHIVYCNECRRVIGTLSDAALGVGV